MIRHFSNFSEYQFKGNYNRCCNFPNSDFVRTSLNNNIMFNERYLLEGEQVGLGRVGEQMEYIGDKFTDYGVEPPKVIEIKDSVVCSNLEKLFEEIKRWVKKLLKFKTTKGYFG